MNSRIELVDSGLLYANPFQGDWAINGYHPRILEVSRGELVCAYRRGAAMYSDDGRTHLARSTDNGATWVQEGPVWDGSKDDQSYNYSATSLAKTRDGEIVLTGFRIHRPTAVQHPVLLPYRHDAGYRVDMAYQGDMPSARTDFSDGIPHLILMRPKSALPHCFNEKCRYFSLVRRRAVEFHHPAQKLDIIPIHRYPFTHERDYTRYGRQRLIPPYL